MVVVGIRNKKDYSKGEGGFLQKMRVKKLAPKTFPCHSCGTTLADGSEYCSYCGFTYNSPKIPDTN